MRDPLEKYKIKIILLYLLLCCIKVSHRPFCRRCQFAVHKQTDIHCNLYIGIWQTTLLWNLPVRISAMHPWIATILKHVELNFLKCVVLKFWSKNVYMYFFLLFEVFVVIDGAMIKGTLQLETLHANEKCCITQKVPYSCA